MKVTDKELYIKQGQAFLKLLKKTNLQGAHQEKIKDIERKIQKTRQSLKR